MPLRSSPIVAALAWALVLAAGCRTSRTARVDRESALRSVVETERGFARAARKDGVQPAFLANVADDGVIFRPRAVAGREWLRANPPEAGDSSLLSWDPRWADVSLAGDLGFTTGPYEFRIRGAADTVAGRGHYVTIWKRTANGSWRFALDIGVGGPSSPQMGEQVRAARPAPFAASTAADPVVWLLEVDRRLGSAPGDPSTTLGPLVGAESWLFRRRQPPVMGPEAIGRILAGNPGTLASTPIAGAVARSGELGYTYGSYDFATRGADRRLDESGNYLRIWRRDAEGAWRLVLDLLSPAPPQSAPASP